MTTREQQNDLWRSLAERSDSELSRQLAARELPPHAAELTDPQTRREFLRLAGASLALAGVTGCTRQPPENILPYVQSPEHIVPGKPLFYATALGDRGNGTGVLVESHMGRPTKIAGNPDHPASLGATDIWSEAAILELYDPERSQVVMSSGGIGTWEDFLSEIAVVIDAERARDGSGVRLLTGRATSPSLVALIESLLAELPEARWHVHEPLTRRGVRDGARLAFGRELVPTYHFEDADVILSLDSDFLYYEPGHLAYTRQFAARRRVSPEATEMNRLYVVEPTPSVTGAMADHRLPLEAFAIEGFSRALAQRLGLSVAGGEIDERHRDWIEAVAEDLASHRGRSVVVAGETASPAVHVLAHAMNDALGNIGRTVILLEAETEAETEPSPLEALVADMDAGDVELLLMVDVNPVYTAPADLRFPERLANVPFRAHMGLYHDETAALCDWHVPRAHELESWGDVRAFNGLVTIQQPLIEPLYFGKTPGQLVRALLGDPTATDYAIVQEYWRARLDGASDADFERFFRTALHAGFVEGTAFAEVTPSVQLDALDTAEPDRDAAGLEILFRADPTVLDGRFALNGWLQELPKPVTKLTWDNAALVAPQTADRLGLETGNVVELRFQGRTVFAPVFVLPGQAEETVTVPLGYGRATGEELAPVVGFDAYRLRTTDALWRGRGAELVKTRAHHPLATTQQHYAMEGRDLIRRATLDEYRENPEFVHEHHEPPGEEETLYPAWDYDGYAWGMVIDLNACTGCSACVTACQAENNIPVVGKEGVLNSREMHWLRVDRYYHGEPENPEMLHQPVLCMHCENAPCEVVCPVAATVHSDEGLNEMIYNRCVGTRYCSNNCPYKVRRFNFLDYSVDAPSLNLMRNPDVSVRSRGVMEKCTYCVQRISAARIEAKKDGRPIEDGEIVTACQSACPAEAIVFGDVNDPDTAVSRLKRDPRNYGILTELNTRPRTTYLAKLTNPNPNLRRREA